MGIKVAIRKYLKRGRIITIWSMRGDNWIRDRFDTGDRNSSFRTLCARRAEGRDN